MKATRPLAMLLSLALPMSKLARADETALFHLYAQTLEAEFASAEDAEAAVLAFRDLPPGMEMSLTGRGDDTNVRHLPHAQALAAAGAKCTYYINGFSQEHVETILRPILALGHSLGAHTKTHPQLTTLNANGIHDEILGNRIAIESATDACVSSFTLPFCGYDNRGNPDARTAIGESLRRTGLLGGGDVLEDPASIYGLPPDVIVGCLRYGFDDKKPSRKLFQEGIAKAEARIKENKLPSSGPHVVMGMHSWADDAGMAELTPCFETQTKNPNAPFAGRTWICTENEFIAAWMQARHTHIAHTERSGARVRWTLLRPEPAEIGADVPLFVDFGRRPVALHLDGDATPVAESAQAALPNAPEHRIPSHIEQIVTPNAPERFPTSVKFPGLRARLDADPAADTAVLHLRNEGDVAVTHLRVTLRLPLAFAADAATEGAALPDTLVPDASADVHFRLKRLHDDPWHGDGPTLFDAELDFNFGDASGRLHVTRRIVVPRTPDPASLRDSARAATALPAGDWPAEKLAALSQPGAPLDGLRLFPLETPPFYAPCSYLHRSTVPEAKALFDAIPKEKRDAHRDLLVAEFTAAGGEATLGVRGGGTLYLNGEERPFKDGTKVPTLAGKNRIVLVTTSTPAPKKGLIAVFENGAARPCPWSAVTP